VIFGGLLVCFATQYGGAFSQPFVNDDYFILEKVGRASLGAALARHPALFGWYRPVSRELYYWVVTNAAGPSSLVFHIISCSLWVAILLEYAVLLRRLGGVAPAVVAVAGVALSTLWAAPVYWAAGAQDLWMLVFGLAFLLAVSASRHALGLVFYCLALMSKESAMLLLPIGVGLSWFLQRRRGDALLICAWGLGLTAVWSFIHPTLWSHLVGTAPVTADLAALPSTPRLIPRLLLSLVNLDVLPRPDGGWLGVVPQIIGGALGAGVILLAARTTKSSPQEAELSEGRYFTLSALWSLIGISPVLSRTVGFHTYYAILGLFGFWMLAGRLLARNMRWAVVALLLMSVLRSGAAATPSWDWGTQWYQVRAGNLLESIRARLFQLEPRVPANSRLFFGRLPNNVGVIAGNGPSIRAWYHDPSLSAFFFSDYSPRGLHGLIGRDYFFRFDTTRTLVELQTGPENLANAMASNPDWGDDHFKLASLFVQHGDLDLAGEEFGKLFSAFPNRLDCALYAAVTLQAAGRPASEFQSLYEQARHGFRNDSDFEDAVQHLKQSLPRTRG
jgi:hypothetical protein